MFSLKSNLFVSMLAEVKDYAKKIKDLTDGELMNVMHRNRIL